jgi:phosphoribosyl 1,2-cyclic phosphodiesterase
MKVRLWGTRGSVAAPGADTARYGGNTSCVEVCGAGDVMVVLDAGTGIRPLGASLPPHVRTVHILLSHLHMDHIQGLGFFKPLFDPESRRISGARRSGTTICAAGSSATSRRRSSGPPRDLPRCKLHDLPAEPFQVGDLRVTAERVCHPGHTVGFRIEQNGNSMAYLSDHEPALGAPEFPAVRGVDVRLRDREGRRSPDHDAQYSWTNMRITSAGATARSTTRSRSRSSCARGGS